MKPQLPQTGQQEGGEEEEKPCEETPEQEVKVEWPSGVPQASVKDLARLSHADGVGKHLHSLLIFITGGGAF